MRLFRRAVSGSLCALEESHRLIDESERCHVHRPRAAARHLQRAADSLLRADGHLRRASASLPDDPIQALAGAPSAMIALMVRFVEMIGHIADTSHEIERTMSRIDAAVDSRGVDLPDAIEPSEVARWALMVTRRYTRPWVLDLELPSLRETIAEFLFPRRQRPAPVAVVDGVRRVCRGRAPPRSSICTF